MQQGDRKRHSGQPQGRVVGRWGKRGRCKREGGGSAYERTMLIDELAVSSYNCWCKKEEKPSLHLSLPPSLSLRLSQHVENNTAAPVKPGERIEAFLGVPRKPDGSHGDRGLLEPLRLLLSINVFQPCVSAQTWAHSLKRSFKTANLCLFLSGRHKEYKLKQDDMQTGRQKFLRTLLSRGFNKRKAAWNSHLLSAAWNTSKNTTASHKPPFIISWQGKKKNWNIWKCWACLKGR